MICKTCTVGILDTGQQWGMHHADEVSALDAARAECVFCACLYRSLGITAVGLQFPLYRWTIRKPAHLRGVPDAVAVTFRVVQESKGATTEFRDRVFYLFDQNDLGGVPRAEELGSTTRLDDVKPQILRWMRTCEARHEDCRNASPQEHNLDSQENEANTPFVPTRLLSLDPGSGAAEDRILVITTKDVRLSSSRYATLSHRWPSGAEASPPPTLDESTMHEYTTIGVPKKALSQTFLDAIDVARALKLSYIWIDSLCIIQRDREDWIIEAPLMHRVYRNSACNIAAADSGGGPGLFRKRISEAVALPIYRGNGGAAGVFGSKTWCVVPDDLWDKELMNDSELYTRGWVFQERMLSPRLLHFAARQLFWDCSCLTACESLPSGIPYLLDSSASTDRQWRKRLQATGQAANRPHSATTRPLVLSGGADSSLETLWRRAVRSYTSCNLTQQTDKLMAIWSVAKLVRDGMDAGLDGYAEGMWSRGLEEQIAWRLAIPGAETEKLAVLADSHPSWSWASWHVEVELRSRSVERRYYTVRSHDGIHPIAFDLRRPTATDVGVSGRGKGKDDAGKTAADYPAELGDKRIALRGFVGKATMLRAGSEQKWTLTFPHVQSAALTGVHVFPDIKPLADSVDISFIVLAATRHHRMRGALPSSPPPHRRLSSPKGSQDGGDDLEIGTAYNTDKGGEDGVETDARYTGVGIMVIQADREDHFVRTGALHFEDIPSDIWWTCLLQEGGREWENGCAPDGWGHRLWVE